MVQDSQDSEQDLKTLEDLEMTFDLGENISADKAKGCYRVLRKYGLKLVKKDVNPCGYGLAHTDGKEIAEGEFSQKLQPAIEQAKSNIKDSSKKDDLTNPSNSPSTAGANHSNSTSSTLSTDLTPISRSPNYEHNINLKDRSLRYASKKQEESQKR